LQSGENGVVIERLRVMPKIVTLMDRRNFQCNLEVGELLIMREKVLNAAVMGRRGFLQACTLLSLGWGLFGFPEAVARPAAARSEFVVVNGWVLPAHHFRQAQA